MPLERFMKVCIAWSSLRIAGSVIERLCVKLDMSLLYDAAMFSGLRPWASYHRAEMSKATSCLEITACNGMHSRDFVFLSYPVPAKAVVCFVTIEMCPFPSSIGYRGLGIRSFNTYEHL